MSKNAGTTAPSLAAVVRSARETLDLSVRELARRAGVSHTQVSRIESGEVAKPSRSVLVALAKGLNRNPLPLLMVAGHLSVMEAQASLRPLFRHGAELREVWVLPPAPAFDLDAVQRLLRSPKTTPDELKLIAADVFGFAETDETLWDEAYVLAAASGHGDKQLLELLEMWRYMGEDLRARWLDYGKKLRDIADAEYLAHMELVELEAKRRKMGEKQ